MFSLDVNTDLSESAPFMVQLERSNARSLGELVFLPDEKDLTLRCPQQYSHLSYLFPLLYSSRNHNLYVFTSNVCCRICISVPLGLSLRPLSSLFKYSNKRRQLNVGFSGLSATVEPEQLRAVR